MRAFAIDVPHVEQAARLDLFANIGVNRRRVAGARACGEKFRRPPEYSAPPPPLEFPAVQRPAFRAGCRGMVDAPGGW